LLSVELRKNGFSSPIIPPAAREPPLPWPLLHKYVEEKEKEGIAPFDRFNARIFWRRSVFSGAHGSARRTNWLSNRCASTAAKAILIVA
jgi:hypothetical protein